MRERAIGLLFLLILGGSPTGSEAQAIRSFDLTADNDGFVFWKPPRERLDRYYTHGLTAEAVVNHALPWNGLLSNHPLTRCGKETDDDACMVTRLGLGQKIFTPNYIFDEDPSNHDRPYAGWLFVEATSTRVEGRTERALGLEVGVTGKPSLAGPAHRWFHGFLKKHPPMGWEHQIPFEPAFLVRYEQRQAISLSSPGLPMDIGWEPSFGANVGTLRTSLFAGLGVQAGWNATRWGEWKGEMSRGFFFRIGLDVEGELIARDLFLDGSTFRSSVHAERKPLVGRLRGRVQIGWSRLALEFRSTRSTLEFQGQDGGHTYGSIALRIFH